MRKRGGESLIQQSLGAGQAQLAIAKYPVRKRGGIYLHMFRLRFNASDIDSLAKRYGYENDVEIETVIGPFMRQHGYLTRPYFLQLCRWKSPRTQPLCASNDEQFIQAVTQTALHTKNERLKIEVLTLLRGVSWPTASVILHFGSNDTYPILDVRALWSLGVHPPPSYTFEFWSSYCLFCRVLARESNVSMRVLDRALWQYSYENQR